MSMGTGGATLLRVMVPMVEGLASVLQRGQGTNKVGNGFYLFLHWGPRDPKTYYGYCLYYYIYARM